jgi:hypothetical protein
MSVRVLFLVLHELRQLPQALKRMAAMSNTAAAAMMLRFILYKTQVYSGLF